MTEALLEPREHFMPKTLKVALAGVGAFGLKHLDAIKLIGGIETDLARRPRTRQAKAASQIWRRTCHHRSRRNA